MTRRFSEPEFIAAVQSHLPGVKFQMHHRDDTYMVEMRLRRAIEEYTYAVSDMDLGADDTHILERATQEAIETIRRKAIFDYGLLPMIEEEKREAAREARVEQRKAWLTWLQDKREVRTVEGPDGQPIEIKMPLPWYWAEIAEMLKSSH